MSEPTTTSEPAAIDLIPSLKKLVDTEGLNPNKLRLAAKTDGQKRIFVPDRHAVGVTDGDKVVIWTVATLSELCRGDRPPPADLEKYPPEYVPYFLFIESHLLLLSDGIGDRTDQEMEEIYAALRRRPDGRSLNLTHDFMWQVAALLLGSQMLSLVEFEGMMSILHRSTRRWALRPISRNYIAYLRQELRQFQQ
jgi:hypothetical protein